MIKELTRRVLLMLLRVCTRHESYEKVSDDATQLTQDSETLSVETKMNLINLCAFHITTTHKKGQKKETRNVFRFISSSFFLSFTTAKC